ncbi:MAG: restriction endonuclease [Bacillota bacterium]
MRIFHFNELKTAPLVIDAIYKSGDEKNISSEPLHELLPRTSNQGGFRITHRKDNMKLPAYVVIYTSFQESEWPDHFDIYSGIFRYYGDNRHPGRELNDTRKKGNRLLCDVFEWLSSNEREKIPPFLIFRKTGQSRDVQFLGLAAPGNVNLSPDRDLVSLWRTKDGNRFQNYEAYFTILDLQGEEISKEWLTSLIYDNENNLKLAPNSWIKFIDQGRDGIIPLIAPNILQVPSKDAQLPSSESDKKLLQIIRDTFKDDPYKFEKCATRLVQLMDPNFYEFDLTRPWRDGGRDAIGKYHIGIKEHPLTIDCALEAKCYAENNSVGVKQMSRLISRIKYRQFGIMITTSYIDKQAYQEVLDDGHPILIINARDIATILKKNDIGISSINNWLQSLEDKA